MKSAVFALVTAEGVSPAEIFLKLRNGGDADFCRLSPREQMRRVKDALEKLRRDGKVSSVTRSYGAIYRKKQ